MVQLKLLIVSLTFFELLVNFDAVLRCPKGERVDVSRGSKPRCAPCHKGTYQPDENESQSCKPCTKCNQKSGSDPIQVCTEDTNTKCQCRGNFTPLDKSDNSTCKCDIGFELKSGECSECEVGYFSTSIDSTCRKWRECKSGVHKAGTKTSDALCKDESNDDAYVSATPTPNNIVPAVKHSTSDRPHEGAQTQKIHTTTTTSAPGLSITRSPPVQPPTAGSHIGVILILGIVLLFVLTAVACKQHIIPKERQQPDQKNESLCRKPVEESGHSSEALLKQNP
ncbi:tumor necrosis factor receptor superfamily member 4 isoform X2 [Sparus aurata]|uniref:Tumor necrosis factor receptor superfamily member 4-like n=1 Tax=Sparus aurata TaxID=8175 RepID=A0A671WFQ4_SPAAU|nr:tumor necrosis factor receptor superfamily member 4-like isoform X2 [Sparus aurata]